MTHKHKWQGLVIVGDEIVGITCAIFECNERLDKEEIMRRMNAAENISTALRQLFLVIIEELGIPKFVKWLDKKLKQRNKKSPGT